MASVACCFSTTSPSPTNPSSRQRGAPRAQGTAAVRRPMHPQQQAHERASLVRGLFLEGRPKEALALLREMALRRASACDGPPDAFSLSSALRACAALRAVKSGREVHAFVLRNADWLVEPHRIESTLVDFYAACGLLVNARKLFDGMPKRDVVTWTIMLTAYARSDGFEHETSTLLEQMLLGGLQPNPHTFTALLCGVGLESGRQLHCAVVKRALDSDAFVGNALVDMYTKHGSLNRAERAFHRIHGKDAACFNTLIAAYARTCNPEALLSVFREMGLEGLAATQTTYVCLLNGCANSGLASLSNQLHTHVTVKGFGHDTIVQGALLDAYAKCGNLDASRAIFDEQGTAARSLVAWNSMIGAYGKHGRGREALEVFRFMEAAGVRPDHITFTCLLSACSHSGLVAEGRSLFRLMREAYEIPPRNEHHCCMVDIMGRAGMVREAYEYIAVLDCEVGASVWGALLNSCRLTGDVEVADIAAERLFALEPDCAGSYVALACIYAAHGRWAEAEAVRGLMERRGIKKEAGCSWTEVESDVFDFRAVKTPEPHGCRKSEQSPRVLTSR